MTRSGATVQTSAWMRSPTKELFLIIPLTHDEQGDNPGQEKEGLTVSSINCHRCWHLD